MDSRDKAPSQDNTLVGEPLERRTSTLDDGPGVDGRRRSTRPKRDGPEQRLARGDEVGRYVILERVGAGGMGVVYAAWDPKLDRKVALKLLHSDKEDHSQRLEREAQAMARLTHPNVIAVHDVGELDGRVFVAMEFVEGRTLGVWAGLGRDPAGAGPPTEPPAPERDWSEILDVLLAAGHGLAAAHEHGLIHRDFKPDNVMIGADARVRVMDFGLVRATGASTDESAAPASPSSSSSARPARLGPESGDDHDTHASLDSSTALESQLTMAGSLLGTPAYMAPEQLRGDEADARADQFAYCVTLWQCLYGERPFGGDTPLAVLFSISNAKFREPAGGRVVPTRLRRALEQGLAADPRERWPDMRALLSALTDDPRSRRRPFVLGASALALAAAAATAAILVQPAPAPSPCAHAGDELRELWSDARARELAEVFAASELVYADETWTRVARQLDGWSSGWIAGRRDACEATEVRHEQSAELLDLRMACLDQRRHSFAALVAVFASADDTVIEKAVEAVEALPPIDVCEDRSWLTAAVRPPDDPEFASAVERVREDVARVVAMTDGGKGHDALELAREAEARARELEWLPLIAEAAMALGRVRQDRAEFSEARAALEAAYFAARRGGHDEVTVKSAYLLIYCLAAGLAEFDAAANWIEHARAEAERVGREDLLAEVYASVGIYHYLQAETIEAEAAFARSLELHTGSPSAELAAAHINYGTILIGVEHSYEDRAFAELDLGVAMLEDTVGPEHPSVAVALSNYATVHGALEHHREAIALLERALQINERAQGKDHPMTALVELNLAINLIELGDAEQLARALALAKRSLATHEQVFDQRHVMRAQSERAVGRALVQLDRPGDAIPHFDIAIEIWTEAFGEDHVEAEATRQLRARCDLDQQP